MSKTCNLPSKHFTSTLAVQLNLFEPKLTWLGLDFALWRLLRGLLQIPFLDGVDILVFSSGGEISDRSSGGTVSVTLYSGSSSMAAWRFSFGMKIGSRFSALDKMCEESSSAVPQPESGVVTMVTDDVFTEGLTIESVPTEFLSSNTATLRLLASLWLWRNDDVAVRETQVSSGNDSTLNRRRHTTWLIVLLTMRLPGDGSPSLNSSSAKNQQLSTGSNDVIPETKDVNSPEEQMKTLESDNCRKPSPKSNMLHISDWERIGTGGDDVMLGPMTSSVACSGTGGGGSGRACFGIGGATRAGFKCCDVGEVVIPTYAWWAVIRFLMTSQVRRSLQNKVWLKSRRQQRPLPVCANIYLAKQVVC